jgi:trans-AT polyketide synthase, acyltransferase and oxidoreductase domains
MKTVFMFSGQGSHYYQMSVKLFEENPVFRNTMCELDEIVRDLQGISVLDELYAKKSKISATFDSLMFTHPAIFMVEYSLTQLLKKRGITPDYVLGCSLGEFAAGVVAGIFSEQDALKLVLRQAEIIELSCPPGEMIAILENPAVYGENKEISDKCTIAAINSQSQFVISGSPDELTQVKTFLKEKEFLHQSLMVKRGFHSSLIDPAESLYKEYLAKQTFSIPDTVFVSGTYGKSLEKLPIGYFWDVIRKPIVFKTTIDFLESQESENDGLVYVDIGPSGSLGNLIKYNKPAGSKSLGLQIMSPFQQEVKKIEELESVYKDSSKAKHRLKPVVTKPSLAYVFPGQGSQRKGMGEGLFDDFSYHTSLASDVLGYSVKKLCLEDPDRNLNNTRYTQPALFVVNALSYLKLIDKSGVIPDFVAGHSLGEYNALFAAGMIDFESGLRLVKARGELMSKMEDGGMAAVKGLSADEISYVIAKNDLTEIDVANYNTYNQIVLSGPRKLIHSAGPYFEAAGASLYFPLNVSGAFHSRYMEPMKQDFETFVKKTAFSSMEIPVISNVEASAYDEWRVRSLLSEQLVKSVRWVEVIEFLMKSGVKDFKEVGPGDVLTKMIWSIQQSVNQLT